MTQSKKYLLIILCVCIVIILCMVCYFKYRSFTPFPTYFSYSEAEKQSLVSLSSDQKITRESLRKWDTIMFNLIKDNKIGDAPASRIYAYLYTAQRDVAFLSKNIKKKFMGNIDVISAQTLCLFFQSNCEELKAQSAQAVDAYSQALANIVLAKIQARIETDKRNTHSYPDLKPTEQHWVGTRPYFGAEVGSWMPWALGSVNNFVAPPPPAYNSPEWQQQLKIVKDALTNITPEQKKLVVFWAGNPGTVTPPGLWLMDVNDYMFSHDIRLSKIFLVRSVLAISMADAAIAVFHSKYLYQVKRPFMLVPSQTMPSNVQKNNQRSQ